MCMEWCRGRENPMRDNSSTTTTTTTTTQQNNTRCDVRDCVRVVGRPASPHRPARIVAHHHHPTPASAVSQTDARAPVFLNSVCPRGSTFGLSDRADTSRRRAPAERPRAHTSAADSGPICHSTLPTNSSRDCTRDCTRCSAPGCAGCWTSMEARALASGCDCCCSRGCRTRTRRAPEADSR